MAENREGDGDENGVETTKVLISNDGTDDRRGIRPEGIELADTERGPLSHAKCTGLTIGPWITTGRLHDTVDDR